MVPPIRRPKPERKQTTKISVRVPPHPPFHPTGSSTFSCSDRAASSNRRSELFSRSVRRLIISSVIAGFPVRLNSSNQTLSAGHDDHRSVGTRPGRQTPGRQPAFGLSSWSCYREVPREFPQHRDRPCAFDSSKVKNPTAALRQRPSLPQAATLAPAIAYPWRSSALGRRPPAAAENPVFATAPRPALPGASGRCQPLTPPRVSPAAM